MPAALTFLWSTLLAALVLSLAGVVARLRPGPIGGRWIVPRLTMKDRHFGRAGSSSLALAIPVDAGGGELLAGAGRLAARALFPAGRWSPFEVRVLHAHARPSWLGRGRFADPSSPWYGISFGICEVAVSRSKWGRPFGYRRDGSLDIEELARLLKADRNYFTNYVYGTPLDALAAADSLDPARLESQTSERQTVAGRAWDAIELWGFEVASPGRSTLDQRQLTMVDAIATRAFRYALGTHNRVPELPASFAPISLRARLRIAHKVERDPDFGDLVYTHILFASARAGTADEPALLTAQMECLERAMSHFPDLGFTPR